MQMAYGIRYHCSSRGRTMDNRTNTTMIKIVKRKTHVLDIVNNDLKEIFGSKRPLRGWSCV